MENKMEVFNNEVFGSVRTLIYEDVVWFVAKDISQILGYKETANMRKLIEREDYREINPQSFDAAGFVQNGMSRFEPNPNVKRMLLVNESGLYQAIFNSTLPEAKAFKRWITHDVLPSIRKHGGYIAGQEAMDDMELLSRAVLLANSVIEEKQQVIESQQKQIKKMDPKAKYYDALVAIDHLTNFRDTAKLLGLGQKIFIDWLLAKKFIYRDKRQRLLPCSNKNRGYFRLKEWGYGLEKAGVQTLITAKGRSHFLELLDEEGLLV